MAGYKRPRLKARRPNAPQILSTRVEARAQNQAQLASATKYVVRAGASGPTLVSNAFDGVPLAALSQDSPEVRDSDTLERVLQVGGACYS